MVIRVCGHMLYFRRKRQAVEVARILRAQGFVVAVEREGECGCGDPRLWGIFAWHPVPLEGNVFRSKFIASLAKELEELARSYEGEYEGWEVVTRSE